MGYYYYTSLFYGFRIYSNSKKIDIVEKWAIKDKKGMMIVVPSSLHTFKCLGSIVMYEDFKKGFISKCELQKREEFNEDILKISKENKKIIDNQHKKWSKEFKCSDIKFFVVEYTQSNHYHNNEIMLKKLIPLGKNMSKNMLNIIDGSFVMEFIVK